MSLSLCLSVSVSISLSINLAVCLPAWLAVCLSFCLSVCLHRWMAVAYDHPNVWPMFAWESTIAGLGSFPWQPHEVLLHDKSPLHDDLGYGPQILSPCHLGVGETPRVGDFLNFLTTWISFGSKNRKSLGSLLSILSFRSCTPLPVSCSCWIPPVPRFAVRAPLAFPLFEPWNFGARP